MGFKKDTSSELTKNLDTVQILPGKNIVELSDTEYKHCERVFKRWEEAGRLVIKEVKEKVEKTESEDKPKREYKKRNVVGE